MRPIFVVILLTRAAPACPLPEIALTAGEGEPSRALAVLEVLVVASRNDATSSDPGRELASLDEAVVVPAEVVALAKRLRLLDCAALNGEAAPAKDYAAVTDDARNLITKLTSGEPPKPPPAPVYQPPPPPPPAPVFQPPPPPAPVFQPPPRLPYHSKRSARQEIILGNLFLGFGAGLTFTAMALTIDSKVGKHCSDCFLDQRVAELVVGGTMWVMGGLALAGGSTLVILGRRELKQLKLQPTIGLTSIGLRGSF